MLETLKMWVIGLPYALYQMQRIKVGVDRFLMDACYQIMESEQEPWYIGQICECLKSNGVSVVIVQRRHDFDPAASLLRARDDHDWN